MIAFSRTQLGSRYYGWLREVTENPAASGLKPLLPPPPAVSTKAGRTIHLRLADVNMLWSSFFSTR